MKIESIAFLKLNLIIIELLKCTTFVVFMFKGFLCINKTSKCHFSLKKCLENWDVFYIAAHYTLITTILKILSEVTTLHGFRIFKYVFTPTDYQSEFVLECLNVIMCKFPNALDAFLSCLIFIYLFVIVDIDNWLLI